MNFESARDLKEEAMGRFVSVPGPRSAGLSGRLKASQTLFTEAVAWAGDLLPGPLGLHGMHGPHARASLGLGVAVSGDGECKLAVRYPWLDNSRAPFLDELTTLAHDEVDVDWTGPLVAAQNTSLQTLRNPCRPLMIGTSVAFERGTAGTVCAFVRRGEGAPELLSCNHVLADCGRAQPNVAILQPGPADGGGARDVVGRLAYSYPLERDAINVVDCALATLDTGIDANHTTLDGFGDLAGLADPAWYSKTAEGRRVAKIGRTTGSTQGKITVLSFSQYIDFPVGPCFFTDLIEIEGHGGPFGGTGDSGSLVFTPMDRLGVGMFVAVTSKKCYVTRLDTVLSRLGAQLAT